MSQRRPAASTPVEVFRTPLVRSRPKSCAGCSTRTASMPASASALSPSLFPMRFGQAEFRISVSSAAAGRARELIAGHLDEAAAIEVRRLSENARSARRAHRLPFQRPRPARARADAPLARPRGRVGRRHRQRVAGVPRRRRARLRHRRHAVHAVSDAQRRLQVEGEGRHRLGGVARAAGRGDRSRPLRAARTRRREDRRPPEARDSRRQLRSAHRRDLSRRRHRAAREFIVSRFGAADRSPPAIARPRRRSPKTGSPRFRSGCRRSARACRTIAWPRPKAPIIASASTSK